MDAQVDQGQEKKKYICRDQGSIPGNTPCHLAGSYCICSMFCWEAWALVLCVACSRYPTCPWYYCRNKGIWLWPLRTWFWGNTSEQGQVMHTKIWLAQPICTSCLFSLLLASISISSGWYATFLMSYFQSSYHLFFSFMVTIMFSHMLIYTVSLMVV